MLHYVFEYVEAVEGVEVEGGRMGWEREGGGWIGICFNSDFLFRRSDLVYVTCLINEIYSYF
jgi:hypothetical protein